MRCNLVVLFSSSLLAAACGDDPQPVVADAAATIIDSAPFADTAPLPPPDADTGSFTVTSPTITDGGAIPVVHSCDGANTSPALTWTAWPAAASYAVVLNDKSIGFLHGAIYDIAAATLTLPADIDKVFEPTDVPGARQSRNYAGDLGYAGPCPGQPHMYEFIVVALDVATLAGTDNGSTAGEIQTILDQHTLATTRLTATYTP